MENLHWNMETKHALKSRTGKPDPGNQTRQRSLCNNHWKLGDLRNVSHISGFLLVVSFCLYFNHGVRYITLQLTSTDSAFLSESWSKSIQKFVVLVQISPSWIPSQSKSNFHSCLLHADDLGLKGTMLEFLQQVLMLMRVVVQ